MKVEIVNGNIKVSFESESDYIISSGSDLTVTKNFLVKYISGEFDRAVNASLRITYPYVVGDETFYSKEELENWIISRQ